MWYPEKQPNLKKWSEILKKWPLSVIAAKLASDGTKLFWLEQELWDCNRVGQILILAFQSLTGPIFFPINAQNRAKSNPIFHLKGKRDTALILRFLKLGGFPQMTSDLYKIFTSDAVQGKVSHILRFLIYSWKLKKWRQKTDFQGFFKKFFGYALPLPMSHAQIFCQMKGLMKIYSRGKFYLHSICGSQVINFQKFSWRWSIHELGHFEDFFGPNLPKYG